MPKVTILPVRQFINYGTSTVMKYHLQNAILMSLDEEKLIGRDSTHGACHLVCMQFLIKMVASYCISRI